MSETVLYKISSCEYIRYNTTKFVRKTGGFEIFHITSRKAGYTNTGYVTNLDHLLNCTTLYSWTGNGIYTKIIKHIEDFGGLVNDYTQ